MSGGVKFLYGEILMKRWGVSGWLLNAMVDDGLTAFDCENRKVEDPSDAEGQVEVWKFRLGDVEKFERENAHMFGMKANPIDPHFKAQHDSGELGKRLTAEEVAVRMKMNVKKVRSMYKELGGMRLGRTYVFFERSVKDAIQKGTEVDSPSAKGREATGESVSDEEASIAVGKQDAAKTRKRLEREDLHGLFR